MTLEDLLLAWDFLCWVVPRIASLQTQCDNVAAVAPLGTSSRFPRTSLTPGNMLIIIVQCQALRRRRCPPS